MQINRQKQIDRLSLSVIIPTLNAERCLPQTITALRSAKRAGIDLDLIVVDSNSQDQTRCVATNLGAKVLQAERGRGSQLGVGANYARGEWLMFLHADTILDSGWDATVVVFSAIERNRERAAVFTFALDDPNPSARRLERLVRWRNKWLGLPYGDQGLLIHRRFYSKLGGYKSWPLMEDIDLIRRIGISRLVLFDIHAITSSEKYRESGYFSRILRNSFCLFLYFIRIPPRWIAHIYARRST